MLGAVGDLWLRLLRLGRGGGLVLVLLALGLFYAGYALATAIGPTNPSELWSPRGTFVGYALILIGLPFAVAGLRNLVAPPPREERVRDDELIAAVTARARPFYVCLRCRKLFAVRECRGGRCVECRSFEQGREIESEQDLERLLEELHQR